MLKLQLTNFANFKKLWFVSAIKARGCIRTLQSTYEPNYTRSRDHALVISYVSSDHSNSYDT